MKNRETLLALLSEEPWALPITTVSTMIDNLLHRSDLEWTAAFARQGGDPSTAGPVQTIPLYGMIEQRAGAFDEFFGVTSIDGFRAAFRAALRDPRIRAIILDVDSPGGGVYGVTEMANEIRAARGGKTRIVAVANTLAASAAYWLASQADEVVVSPSGSVGSIGIVAVHQEFSKALEAEGVSTTIISSGPFKTEGNPYEPLTDAARTALQERSDAFYASFVSDVARGRRTTLDSVKSNFGEGRVVLAAQALAAGMVDRVETLDATMARLQAAFAPPGAVRALADWPDFGAAAIPVHHTDTVPSAPLAGEVYEARLPQDRKALRAAHAWVDPDGDPDLKGSYRFKHHIVNEDGTVGAAVEKFCSTDIGVLNGGRAGTTIPEEDKRGVWEHEAAHLRDAHADDPKYEPPPLTGLAPAAERLVAVATEAASLVEWARTRARLRAKEGRSLYSTTTETALRATRDAIDALLTGDPGAEAVNLPGDPADPPEAQPRPTPPAKPAPISRADFIARLEEETTNAW